MKKFITQIILFLILAVVAAELMLRVFHLTIDAPRAYPSENGLVKYYPGQEGFHKNDGHKWYINKYGYAGNVPASTDNLIAVIGDSFIENLMNPLSCHQDVYLKKLVPGYNYLEGGRAGASVIEMFEMSKEFDTLHPKLTIMYLKEGDFTEGIASLNKNDNNVRVDLEKNKILYQKYKGSKLKDFLYNVKVVYYLYRNVIQPAQQGAPRIKDKKVFPEKVVGRQIDYLVKNYPVKNKLMVFVPGTNPKLLEMCRAAGFKTVQLEVKGNKVWELENDIHWSCYGHEEVAKQVAPHIEDAISGEK
jgi:hypothetical protein